MAGSKTFLWVDIIVDQVFAGSAAFELKHGTGMSVVEHRCTSSIGELLINGQNQDKKKIIE